MSKKMKKFFSLMLVALVMLGVTACEQDVTIDTPKSEGLSFYAEIAMTRADLEQGTDGKWATVWEGNETLYVNEFAFTNTESEPSKFTCTTEGVAKLLGQDVTIKMENNSVPESGKGIMIEQTIESFNPESTISLKAKNAFFRFTYTGDVTFTLSQPLFVVEGATTDTITVTADGDTWVSVLPGENVTLSYSVIDIECKETTLNIVAGTIFNLKELVGPDPSMLRYELVTDASQLGVGDYVIIAAADSDFALSTTQNNNNRGQVAITKKEGSSIIDYVDGVEVLTLKKGTTDGTYSFYTGEGYLYAASSSSNYLRTEATLSANSSWNITIENGAATIKAQGENTRNSLLYNKTNSLFSCYANSSDSMTAVALYVGKNDPRTALETPELNATLEGKIIKLSWDSITNAKDYTVTFGNNEPKTVVDTTTTFDGEWNTSYEITVVANPVDDTKYIQSSATISVAIGSDPSSTDKVDILNCALTGVTGTSYTEWSDKTATSKASYAGQSAGGNESIQLRSNNSNSGIVTTTSGGKVKKVVVTWNSNTSTGRTLDVYGKNTAYSAATDLYSTSTQGTKIGSIVCGTSTELIIDGVYQYIGMRSKDGAMYIDEIQITWAEMTADDVAPAEPLAKPSLETTEVTENTITVSWKAITGAIGYKVSIDGDANKTDTTVGTSYEFTDLTAGTEYTIRVVALGDGVTTKDSEVAIIKAVPTSDIITTYTFSDYTAGTQYAENEAHKLDDVLTITTTDCHFTTELRIYSSSTNDGYAIGKLAEGTIKKLGFNAGYKADTLNVYGSTDDGSTWTLIEGVSVTSAYKDYTVDFGDTNYTSFKLDVAGTNQIRVKTLTLTYAK